MADKKLFAITGFNGGVSIGIQADTPEEFATLIADLQQYPNLAPLFAQAVPAQTVEQAAQVIHGVFPLSTPQSTVGQPLPQPAVAQPAVAQPAAQPFTQRVYGAAGGPPGVVYPGDCPHGPRVYNDKPARGKPWQRWECNVPWKRDAQGRCENVNV